MLCFLYRPKGNKKPFRVATSRVRRRVEPITCLRLLCLLHNIWIGVDAAILDESATLRVTCLVGRSVIVYEKGKRGDGEMEKSKNVLAAAPVLTASQGYGCYFFVARRSNYCS